MAQNARQVALLEKEKENKKLIFAAQKQFEASNNQMDFIREAGFALQILMENDYLAKSDAMSIRNAVVNVALTGLSLNPALKEAYLIPRAGKCVLDISYMGMIKLLTERGAIKNVDAGVIYENDKFDYRKGSNPYFKITPTLMKRGKMIGAYAIAYFRDGGYQFEVMSREDIEKIRATSESWKNEKTRKYSPWENWEDKMWKKTALKRLFKILPKSKFSDKLIAALSVEDSNENTDLPGDLKKDKYESMFEDMADFEDVSSSKQSKERKNQTSVDVEYEEVKEEVNNNSEQPEKSEQSEKVKEGDKKSNDKKETKSQEIDNPKVTKQKTTTKKSNQQQSMNI